jgi:nickel transport protein
MTMAKIALCALSVVFLIAAPASAHKVSVFGYTENGMLLGEAYFPGGGKAKGSKIELIGPKGKLLATTQTDNQGAFKLELPKAEAPLKLMVTAGMGHKGEYVLTAQDLGQGQKGQESVTDGSKTTSQASKSAPIAAVNEDKLQSAIEKALEKKLAPLKAQIAKMQAERAIGVSDVIGGLGYILGLLGLAAYMKSRKQT